MSTATDAIRFIETLQKQGIKKQAATEIVSFVGLYDIHMSSTTNGKNSIRLPSTTNFHV